MTARAPNRRKSPHDHPSTNPVKIMVAGLRTGFPIQYVSAALVDARRLLSPSARGAAQHVHIIDGVAAKQATSVDVQLFRPSRRRTQSFGMSVCTAAPARIPSSQACQTAARYIFT